MRKSLFLELAKNWAYQRFDHTCSAHLVLEEARVVVEFPSASTALILSASCTHSNTAIQPGDQCLSMTQYAAGPLFRFVQNRFMTEDTFRLSDPSQWAENERLKDKAWERALKQIPTVASLIEY